MANGTLKVQNIETSSGSGTITLGQSGETLALGASNISGFGKIGQIQQATFTGNETTSSTSFSSTSLSVSITPTSTSSKVFIMLTSGFWSGASDQIFLQLRRGASTVLLPYTGASGATLTAGASTMLNGSVGTRAKESWNLNYSDSPASTSAITYAVYWKVNSGTATLGKWGLNDDFGAVSTITAMEVLG